MANDDEGWVSHDSGKPRKPVDDGEDDSIELDSKEYEEWRRGTDNDSYMSDSKYFGGTTSDYTPVSSSGDSGDDSSSDRNIIIVAVVVVLLLIGSGLLGIYLYVQGSEDVASWPTVEGMVLETYYEDGFDEECTDDNDDSYYDDNECTETFWCEIKVIYNFTADSRTYNNAEDVSGDYGESSCQEELEGRYAVNGTVTIHYNPDKPDENYIVNEPSSGIAIVFCALPVIIIIIILAVFSQIRSGNFEPGRMIGWGRFGGRLGGGFGRMRSRRGRSPVRRSRTRTTRTRSRRK
ncbi:MAG TPA: DUF3592 domain-containing protein [Marine Group III euryarchaeote]|uniref:DUF3592 domain-containing protein n=1 Tax=Marine Group III euryarchaeote TaxID=2173149 RepID=A0A7C7ZDM1_9ARCH|nr:DUF3592 domain-containing protein [Marine Group III euryarchaeote]